MDLKGAEIRNILNLCKEMNSSDSIPLRVNIPHYQRPYKWDQERIQNLIFDFFKNKEDETNEEYFVGSVVLVKNTKIDGIWQDIIDGQQRITTVFLLNYLRFLLLRAFTEDLIIRKSSASFSDQMTKLIACYTSLLGCKKKSVLEKVKQKIIDKIDLMEDADDVDKDSVWDEILKLYQDKVGLPEKNMSDEKLYQMEYSKGLFKFLADEELSLRYSRDSYNLKLKEALSKVMLVADKTHQPKLEYISVLEDPIINQYTMALHYEFEALKEKVFKKEDEPLILIKKMLSAINEMEESIKFCVIMTGNENDAYTLFEVLNDRAMKVDDLDLIKNLFLKEYCNKSKETDRQIDHNVAEIDNLWGDVIFTHNLSQAHTKLISYLGTIYLTADEDIHTNKIEKYREILDRKYLSVQYADKPYTALNVMNDIKIYQMLRVILERFNIHVQKTESDALKAELENNKSITYRTMHLVNALNQNGVMAALTNLIIRTYIDNHVAAQAIIDINDFKIFVDKLKNDYNCKVDEFSEIHKWAFEIWKTSLLAKDYATPRSIARRLISLVSASRNAITGMAINRADETQLEKEFFDWTEAWQYGSTKQNLKIRILFVELFSTFKDVNVLKTAPASISFKTDKLHLDHLDAHNPDSSCMELYYTPADPTVRREKIINGLGNMMLLDQDDNNDKNNKPLKMALHYYDKMCPSGHWLITEVEDLLQQDNCHEDISYGTEIIPVPNDQFFIERRKRLQKYFYAILRRREWNDNEVNI